MFWYIILFIGLLVVVYGTTIAVSVVEPFLAPLLLGMCIAFVRLGEDFILVSKLVTRYMQLGRLVGL